MDYKNLPTPPACVADFCLIPIGTLTASVSNEVAAVQRLMKGSGLTYTMHSAGTTVEGTWEEVTRLIGQAHSLLHQNGVVRIQTDIRIGTRTDKSQHFSEKVSKVEAILAADYSSSTASSSRSAPSAPAIAKKKESQVPIHTEGNAVGKGDAAPLPGPGTNKGTWASMFKQ